MGKTNNVSPECSSLICAISSVSRHLKSKKDAVSQGLMCHIPYTHSVQGLLESHTCSVRHTEPCGTTGIQIH